MQGIYGPRKANLLKLLQLLTSPHPISLEEISQHLPKLKNRTIFSYLKAIEEEYPLERRRKPFPAYRIKSEFKNPAATLDESDVRQLQRLIKKEGIQSVLEDKLNAFLRPARNPLKDRYPETYRTVENCMKNRWQLLLENYASRDGLLHQVTVHPTVFDPIAGKLTGYFINKTGHRIFRDFKIENMFQIRCIEKKAHELNTYSQIRDVFGFFSNDNNDVFKIKLEMSSFAHSMLIRQFRFLSSYIQEKKQQEFPFILQITVFDIQPIARFATGLLNEVRLRGDNAAKKALKSYIERRVLTGYEQNFGESLSNQKW
jgi:energy-converting hydrogenase A subunit M